MVLDEATSALDPATEADILPALRQAGSQTAVLLVAHRYSTVRHADRVVALAHGRVAETSTPTELLQRRGAYWQFVHHHSELQPKASTGLR